MTPYRIALGIVGALNLFAAIVSAFDSHWMRASAELSLVMFVLVAILNDITIRIQQETIEAQRR